MTSSAIRSLLAEALQPAAAPDLSEKVLAAVARRETAAELFGLLAAPAALFASWSRKKDPCVCDQSASPTVSNEIWDFCETCGTSPR